MKMETTDEIIARIHEAMSDLEDAPKTVPMVVLAVDQLRKNRRKQK